MWRNQLLGLALEEKGPFKNVYFSVVHHPGNKSLTRTIDQYKELTNHNPKFSAFTSNTVVDVVKQQNKPKLNEWADWYCGLYKL